MQGEKRCILPPLPVPEYRCVNPCPFSNAYVTLWMCCVALEFDVAISVLYVTSSRRIPCSHCGEMRLCYVHGHNIYHANPKFCFESSLLRGRIPLTDLFDNEKTSSGIAIQKLLRSPAYGGAIKQIHTSSAYQVETKNGSAVVMRGVALADR